MEVEDLIKTTEFENYVCGCIALSFVGQKLGPYTEDVLKQIHQTIASSVHPGNRTCTQDDPCSKRSGGIWCPNCKAWRHKLQKYHSNPLTIKWNSQNSWEWAESYENIVGIFMQFETVNFKDVSCARQIWWSCTEFFKTQRKQYKENVLTRVGRCRNDLIAHNPKLRLDPNEKSFIFDTLRDLITADKDALGKDFVKECLESLEKTNNLTPLALPEIKASLQKITDSQDKTLQALRHIIDLEIERLDIIERLIQGGIVKIQGSLDQTNQLMALLIRMFQELYNYQLGNMSWTKRIVLIAILLATSIFVTIVIVFTIMHVYGYRISVDVAVRHAITDDVEFISYSDDGNNGTIIGDISAGCLSESQDHPFSQDIRLLSYLLTYRRNKMVGREWLFQILERKVLESNTYFRGILMTAHYGFGKSAIAAQLICARENEVGWNLRKHVVAFHVCVFSDDNTKKPLLLIKRMILFLYMKSEEYRKYYASFLNNSIINDDDKCQRNILTCFDHAIKNPLDTLPVPDDAPWIVVIDALDECTERNEHNRILDLLSNRLIHLQQQVPTWFKFIITSRTMPSLQKLEKLDSVHFASDDERNYKDIQQYVLRILNISFEDFPELESFVRNSEGNVLYIKLALEYILKSGNFSAENIAKLLKKMEDIYELNFDRLFDNNHDFEIAKPVLQLISVENLERAELLKCFKIFQISNVTHDDQFERIMNKLFFFVASDFYVRFRHKSLYEWLISENNTRYRISLSEGHSMISDCLFIFSRNLSKSVLRILWHTDGNNLYLKSTKMYADLAFHISELDDKHIEKKFLLLDIKFLKENSKPPQNFYLLNAWSIRSVKMLRLILNITEKRAFHTVYKRYIQSLLYDSIVAGRIDFVTYLHENVIDLNEIKGCHLHEAALFCHEDVALYLIDVVKLSPTQTDSFGVRASDVACYMDCVSVLKVITRKYPDQFNLDMQCFLYSTLRSIVSERTSISEIGAIYLENVNNIGCVRKMQQIEMMKRLYYYPFRYLKYLEDRVLTAEFIPNTISYYFATFSKYTFLHFIINTNYDIFMDCDRRDILFNSEIEKSSLQRHTKESSIGYRHFKKMLNGSSELLSCTDVQGFTPGLLIVALNKLGMFSQVLHYVTNNTCQPDSTGMVYIYNYFRNYIRSTMKFLFPILSCPRGASLEHLLMRHKRIEMIKLLVANGYTLDWTKTDWQGRTPLDYAKEDFIESLEFYFGIDIHFLSDKESLMKVCQYDRFYFFLFCLMCIGASTLICVLLCFVRCKARLLKFPNVQRPL